jgi:hypothetical protein
MPVLNANDAISPAFHLLASVVTELYSVGRSRLGAKLKLELKRRTYNNFSEQQLGFAKFGDFLRAAENAKVIQLTWSPGGDLEAWPPNVSTSQLTLRPVLQRLSSPQSVAAPLLTPMVNPIKLPSVIRVRQDLWNAFNSFSSSWVYDRAKDLAYKLPLNQAPDSEHSKETTPISGGRERVLKWMREFSEGQEPGTKARLLTSLDGESAPYHFNSAIALDPKLRRAWRRFHVQRVLEAIDAWAVSNNLRPNDVAASFQSYQRPHWPVLPDSSQPRSPVLASDVVAAPQKSPATVEPVGAHLMTPRLITLVDELIDELLRLRGSLQVVMPKQ